MCGEIAKVLNEIEKKCLISHVLSSLFSRFTDGKCKIGKIEHEKGVRTANFIYLKEYGELSLEDRVNFTPTTR